MNFTIPDTYAGRLLSLPIPLGDHLVQISGYMETTTERICFIRSPKLSFTKRVLIKLPNNLPPTINERYLRIWYECEVLKGELLKGEVSDKQVSDEKVSDKQVSDEIGNETVKSDEGVMNGGVNKTVMNGGVSNETVKDANETVKDASETVKDEPSQNNSIPPSRDLLSSHSSHTPPIPPSRDLLLSGERKIYSTQFSIYNNNLQEFWVLRPIFFDLMKEEEEREYEDKKWECCKRMLKMEGNEEERECEGRREGESVQSDDEEKGEGRRESDDEEGDKKKKETGKEKRVSEKRVSEERESASEDKQSELTETTPNATAERSGSMELPSEQSIPPSKSRAIRRYPWDIIRRYLWDSPNVLEMNLEMNETKINFPILVNNETVLTVSYSPVLREEIEIRIRYEKRIKETKMNLFKYFYEYERLVDIENVWREEWGSEKCLEKILRRKMKGQSLRTDVFRIQFELEIEFDGHEARIGMNVISGDAVVAATGRE